MARNLRRINADVNAELLDAMKTAAARRGLPLRRAMEQAFALWVQLSETPAAEGYIKAAQLAAYEANTRPAGE